MVAARFTHFKNAFKVPLHQLIILSLSDMVPTYAYSAGMYRQELNVLSCFLGFLFDEIKSEVNIDLPYYARQNRKVLKRNCNATFSLQRH